MTINNEISEEADASFLALFSYCVALMISTNAGFKEAPPTRKPSMSGQAPSSLQLLADTDPP